MLNSFWGKLGQRENFPATKTITTMDEWYDMLENPDVDSFSTSIISEKVAEVHYTLKSEPVPSNPRTSIFMASFTTCWARLRLYSYLEKLGDQVIYMDTDSIIYRWKRGQYRVSTALGWALGRLKDELDGHHILSFASAGPKNYSYIDDTGNSVIKVKGIQLSSDAKQTLNPETMKALVLNEVKQPICTDGGGGRKRSLHVTDPNRFVRGPQKKSVHLMSHTKTYQLVFNSRVINPDNFMSFPFGYEWHPPTEE
ncbi:uncharacterized protein [Montipora capricornis]|uniref:uncharacterized protein n=1 Tax=Montipora capricornis TaxID=246305 RepID=UPI0035F16F7E